MSLLVACGAEPASTGPRLQTTGGETAIIAGTVAPDSVLNVGTIALKQDGQWWWAGCTGTLISPRVFVTAAHCFAGAEDMYPYGITFAPSVPMWDPIAPEVIVYPARVFVHPEFTFDDTFDQFSTDPDVAVFVLDKPARGVKPAELVGPAYFDRRGEHLVGKYFGIAGYGVSTLEEDDWGGTRRYTAMKFREVFPGMVVFDRVPGGGTPCFLDSGGPAFPADADAKRFPRNVDVLTSITRALYPGEPLCGGSVIYTRLDTPAAQSFIRSFMND